MQRAVRVLMVDDDQADIDLTMDALHDDKVDVDFHAVHDGQQCLAYLRQEDPYGDAECPDVVLLDLNMPRMGGLETLKAIRNDPDLRRMPVVILTTSDADKDVVASYELNANCYVTKPVDLDQFTRVVHAIENFWFKIVKLPDL